jgi:hypothetical protein
VFLNHSIKWADYPEQEGSFECVWSFGFLDFDLSEFLGYIRARSFQTGNVTRRREDGLLVLIYLTQSDIKVEIERVLR